MTDRELTPDDFTPLIGSEFIARGGGAEDGLSLTEVELSPHMPIPGFRQPFSLLFDGTRSDIMIGDSLELLHPELGSIWVLPTPIGRTAAGGFRYQVVFT